jgi:stearoyl-CoA desaturase (delta-9 desaturase)
MILSGIGKDTTAVFNGGVYNHTNAAHNLLASMRVAALRGGVEVEAWKESYSQNQEPHFSSCRLDNIEEI